MNAWCGYHTFSDLINLLTFLSQRTAGPEVVPPQTYDYNALNSFALQPKDVEARERSQMEAEADDGQADVNADGGQAGSTDVNADISQETGIRLEDPAGGSG